MDTFCLHTVSQTFGLVFNWNTDHGLGNFSRCLHNYSLRWVKILVYPSPGTFFHHQPQFIIQWINVWAGGGQSSISMKSGCALSTSFVFFSHCEWVQNPAESATHLYPRIQFPLEVMGQHLMWLVRPPLLFLHRCGKMKSGLPRVWNPLQTITKGGWCSFEPLGFCLWPHTNF